MASTIRVASHDEADWIASRLFTFNRATVPALEIVPLQWVIEDEGVLIGGLSADLYLGWLSIHVLWIDEAMRHRGLGTRLLQHAEDAARAHGAHGAFLDTFDWQALAFYQRHGYDCFGTLDDFPPGHSRHFLRKSLLPVDAPS
ncbi:GNAT family N-acetyltransferase [Luteimonas sp. TWI1437]|uniref:GNAT family N-acetyltransferase n=1 Tax=unclassified Luteimonas TaxID=2629088 RepID=UPI00320A88E9